MPTFQEAYHAVSQQDHQRIIRISKAVKPLAELAFGRLASGDLVIALTQCHGGVCPLDLERMEADIAAGDGAGALHDVAGIYQHIDRDTGELTDCFSPRYALPGKGGLMSDDAVRCLSIPGSEYELREFESGLWGAQPPKGGRWSQENTAAEALIAAGWGGEDGDRKTVYDFDGNAGHLLYRNDERGFVVVDWSYSGGGVEITETDDLRGEDVCFGCGTKLHWGHIQTRQFQANWQETTCPICGEDARLEERGSHWYRS